MAGIVRTFLISIGLLVLLLMLASSGVMAGQMCVGEIGCVGASDSGIRLHGTGP